MSGTTRLTNSDPQLTLTNITDTYNGGKTSIQFQSKTSNNPMGKIECVDVGVSPGVYQNDMIFYTGFNTNLVENMRIKANGGYLGIGKTSPTATLDVSGTVSFTSGSGITIAHNGQTSYAQLITNSTGQTAGWNSRFAVVPYLGAANYNNMSSNGDIGIIWGAATGTNGSLLIAPHSTTAGGLKILSDGKVGIGTTPTAPLHVKASSGTTPDINGIYLNNPTNSASNHSIISTRVAGASAGNPFISWDVYNTRGWCMGIDNSDSQKLKISQSWSTLNINTIVEFDIPTSVNPVKIYGNVSVVGNITCGNVITTAIYVSSDYRIKNNVEPISISRTIDLLRPVEYDFASGNTHQMGFIAHEVQELFPFLVTGDKDGPESQTVNYTGLIALLVKEIQRLKERINNAEEKIDMLLKK